MFYISVTAFRLLLLVLLLASVTFPRTVPIEKAAASTTEISDSAALLSATQTNGASYGTFHEGAASSQESEDTVTAAPSQDGDSSTKVIEFTSACCVSLWVTHIRRPSGRLQKKTRKKLKGRMTRTTPLRANKPGEKIGVDSGALHRICGLRRAVLCRSSL